MIDKKKINRVEGVKSSQWWGIDTAGPGRVRLRTTIRIRAGIVRRVAVLRLYGVIQMLDYLPYYLYLIYGLG